MQPSNFIHPGISLSVSGSMQLERWDSYFSDRELAHFRSIGHADRRIRWTRGRIVAKYLFLSQMYKGGAGSCIDLAPNQLNEFSPWMYRNTEVLSKGIPQYAYPVIQWCKEEADIGVSIAHLNSKSCVCLHNSWKLGVDLEQVRPLRAAFYKKTFSREEQEWVATMVSQSNVTPFALFTLLWTLKEAALKAGISEKISVWNFSTLNLTLPDDISGLVELLRQQPLLNKFVDFPLKITTPEDSWLGHASVAANGDHILSIVKFNP